jgi:hypothetical protein
MHRTKHPVGAASATRGAACQLNRDNPAPFPVLHCTALMQRSSSTGNSWVIGLFMDGFGNN